jgi:chemotaxis methyl-accepting protein methylase
MKKEKSRIKKLITFTQLDVHRVDRASEKNDNSFCKQVRKYVRDGLEKDGI